MELPLILVVEDDPIILMEVETSLTEAGFDVVSAQDAVMAMKLYGESTGAIRAMVTDIQLGSGLTGWDLARHVRETSPAMPVVYMSGDSSGEWTAQGVPHSVMLAKPFAFSQLITAVANLLNQTDAGIAGQL